MTLACLMLAGTATLTQPSSATGGVPADQPGLTRDDAVSLVLGSDYYRVLFTMPTQFAGLDSIDFRYPGNWLIEATLVP